MRTTIRLDDDLLQDAKREAAASGVTLTAVIEASLRERLYRSRGARSPGKTAPLELETFGGDGSLPGVDLSDSASLLDLMDSPPR